MFVSLNACMSVCVQASTIFFLSQLPYIIISFAFPFVFFTIYYHTSKYFPLFRIFLLNSRSWFSIFLPLTSFLPPVISSHFFRVPSNLLPSSPFPSSPPHAHPQSCPSLPPSHLLSSLSRLSVFLMFLSLSSSALLLLSTPSLSFAFSFHSVIYYSFNRSFLLFFLSLILLFSFIHPVFRFFLSLQSSNALYFLFSVVSFVASILPSFPRIISFLSHPFSSFSALRFTFFPPPQSTERTKD